MVGEYLMFFKITHTVRVNLPLQKIKLCSFTNLISQKFSDTAIILAIKNSSVQALHSRLASCECARLESSTGFLFTYHSAIPEKFFQRILFQWNSWLWGTIFNQLPLFLGIFRLPKSSERRRYARGGTLGTSGCGCAAGTLEPLIYTRSSSAEFCYPIRE